jgi:hypothetical protein
MSLNTSIINKLREYEGAVSWIRRLVVKLLSLGSGFDPRPVYVSFVVEQATLEEVYLRGLRFSSVTVIPPMLNIHSSTVTDTAKPYQLIALLNNVLKRIQIWYNCLNSTVFSDKTR